MSSLPRRSSHCHPPFCHKEISVEAPKSFPAKKKIMEFSMTFGLQLLMVALFRVIRITLLLCLATDTVQSENTWVSFVAHLYISAISVLTTLAAFSL